MIQKFKKNPLNGISIEISQKNVNDTEKSSEGPLVKLNETVFTTQSKKVRIGCIVSENTDKVITDTAHGMQKPITVSKRKTVLKCNYNR